MNNLKKLQKQYDEVIKELIDLIGDETVNLVLGDLDSFQFDVDYISYHVNNNKYDIKSVFVSHNKLCFNVDLVAFYNDSSVEYIDEQMFLDEIPLEYVYDILKWIYMFVEKE